MSSSWKSTCLHGLALVMTLFVSGSAYSLTPSSEASISPAPSLMLEASPDRITGGCIPDDETLCLLGDRVQLRVRFRDQRADGREGVGKASPLGDRTGTFWFFREDNVEVIVKALDGSAQNGHFWIFLGSLSDVEYWVDAVTAEETTVYYNPPGNLFGLADLTALRATGGPLCGTIEGITCAAGQFCDLQEACGVSDAAGTCSSVPEGCTTVFDPVCGCDGVTYSNDCVRRMEQVQRDHFGACGVQPAGS